MSGRPRTQICLLSVLFGVLRGAPQILGSLVLKRQVFLGLAVARQPVEKRNRDLNADLCGGRGRPPVMKLSCPLM